MTINSSTGALVTTGLTGQGETWGIVVHGTYFTVWMRMTGPVNRYYLSLHRTVAGVVEP